MQKTIGTPVPGARADPEHACPIAPVVDIVFSRWTTPTLAEWATTSLDKVEQARHDYDNGSAR